MAELSTDDRAEVWGELMHRWSKLRDPVGVTKQDLRAAIDAIDIWLNNNAASANAAIPQPARGALTAPQKAFLLMHVISKRYVKGA